MSVNADVLAELTPADIGLGDVFPSFRPIQLEAMEFAVYREERIVGLGLPTGSGKTGVALGIQALTGWRTVVATATKGLMQQYMDTVRGSKYALVDLKGKANYDCVGGIGASDCEEGRHKDCDLVCGSKEFSKLYDSNSVRNERRLPACTYDARRMEMLLGPCTVTNYALWLYSRQGWGNVDCLILDEGHAAMEQLAGCMSVRLGERELREHLRAGMEDVPDGGTIKDWQDWMYTYGELLKERIKVLKGAARTAAGLKLLKGALKLDEKLETMTGMDADWIVEARGSEKYGRSWEFDAVWPGRYAEGRLFKGVGKVVLMSATLKPKAITDLGVKRGEFAFKEWRRVFQRTRCPIYYMPAKGAEGKQIRVTQKSKEADLLAWVEHIDGLLDQRANVRVVLLTTSYKYQSFLMEHSRHKANMVGNTQDPDSDDATEVFEKFIRTRPPVILCSPSFGTGWDFKDDRCRFLVISKVPLTVPGSADRLMAKRLERDKEYGNNLTMQAVAQAVGRPQRSEEDWGEIVITDGSWGWFGFRNKHLAPIALCDDVRAVDVLPAPPKINNS